MEDAAFTAPSPATLGPCLCCRQGAVDHKLTVDEQLFSGHLLDRGQAARDMIAAVDRLALPGEEVRLLIDAVEAQAAPSVPLPFDHGTIGREGAAPVAEEVAEGGHGFCSNSTQPKSPVVRIEAA
ncbi:hypothetical protein SPHV1_100057 [Novosphingobium sp. KN65.2]|nr:hypothetical protein SPHV1_100057 [Novosphingobium sp. KN65.2]